MLLLSRSTSYLTRAIRKEKPPSMDTRRIDWVTCNHVHGFTMVLQYFPLLCTVTTCGRLVTEKESECDHVALFLVWVTTEFWSRSHIAAGALWTKESSISYLIYWHWMFKTKVGYFCPEVIRQMLPYSGTDDGILVLWLHLASPGLWCHTMGSICKK